MNSLDVREVKETHEMSMPPPIGATAVHADRIITMVMRDAIRSRIRIDTPPTSVAALSRPPEPTRFIFAGMGDR